MHGLKSTLIGPTCLILSFNFHGNRELWIIHIIVMHIVKKPCILLWFLLQLMYLEEGWNDETGNVQELWVVKPKRSMWNSTELGLLSSFRTGTVEPKVCFCRIEVVLMFGEDEWQKFMVSTLWIEECSVGAWSDRRWLAKMLGFYWSNGRWFG